MFWPNLKSVASPVPEIIAIGVLGFGVGVANPNLGEEEAVGDRDGRPTIRKSVGEFPYRPSVVTFPLSSRVSEIIVAFLLQHVTFSPPTSSLPQISPCSPVSRWMIVVLRRAKVLGYA